METISTSNPKFIQFPYTNQYSESFIINNNEIYFPLNGPNAGWYLYNEEKRFTLLQPFLNGEIVLGSKQAQQRLVGAVSNKGSITIYDLNNKTVDSIYVGGYPNDLCIDEDDPNIVYLITNVNFSIYSCKLYKINLTTKSVVPLLPNGKFIIGTGLNIKNNQIYLSTLTHVYQIDKNTLQTSIISNNDANKPFYDNASIDGDNINFAIYDYNQNLITKAIEYPYLYGIFQFLMSLTVGVGYLDVTNNNRTMTYNKPVEFFQYNVFSKIGKMLKLDSAFVNFDNCTTQVNRFKDNTFCFVNWKANAFLLVDLNL
jgi:hypothetical protein